MRSRLGLPPARRWIVYEQETVGSHRVLDVFGLFYSWEKATALHKKLTADHPTLNYGVRELLHGNAWLKGV